MKISLKKRFYLSVSPLTLILPFLLYSLAAPYGQLNALFGSYEIDTYQALDAEKLEVSIHKEYITVLHLVLDDGTDVEYSNLEQKQLEESRQLVDISLTNLRNSIGKDRIEKKQKQADEIANLVQGYKEFTELGKQALVFRTEGKQQEALEIVYNKMDDILDLSLIPKLDEISSEEINDVENNLPLLVGIISQYGVIPIPALKENMDHTGIEFHNTLSSLELYRLIDSLQIETYHHLLLFDSSVQKKQPTPADGSLIRDAENGIETILSNLKAISLTEQDSKEREDELGIISAMQTEYLSLKVSIQTVVEDAKTQDASISARTLGKTISASVDKSLQPKVKAFIDREEHSRNENLASLRNYLQRTAYIIYLVCLIVFLIGILGILRFSTTIITPIITLRNATLKIAQGDFSTRVAITSKDEIGELGESFNLMMQKLQDSYKELELKVEERTKELEALRKQSEEKVTEKTSELEKEKTESEDIRRLNTSMVDRELKMVELKAKITDLEKQLAQ